MAHENDMSIEQARVVAGILRDPEVAGKLSLTQQAQLTEQLRDFQATRQKRKEGLGREGLSLGQTGVVVAAEDVATPGGTGAPIHPKARAAAVLGGSLLEGTTQAIEGVRDLGNEVGVVLGIQSREDADEFKQLAATRRMNEKLDAEGT